MPCSSCGATYAPEGTIASETAHAITGICCGCAAEHILEDRGKWLSCVPVFVLAGAVQAALEEADEWGYVEALREAREEDERQSDGEDPETRAELVRCLGSLREHAQEFDLADLVEEALAS